MMTSKIGQSTLKDAKAAGKEAAMQVKDLQDSKLLFVYAGVQYNFDDLVAGIKEIIPNVPIVGNSSFTGVVTPDGYISSDDGFVGIMAMGGSLTVGTAGLAKTGDPRAIGKKAAEEAMKAAGKTEALAYFYMAAPPAEEEFFLKGVTEVIGRVPFFGGSAADNSISGEWSLFADKSTFADGVVLAFFYTDSPMANVFTGAYKETTDVGVITKIEGNRTLVEIDGVPAVKKYAEWRGMPIESFMGGALLAETITSPLGVKDPLGDLVAIRHPMNGNDDYSMNIGNNLAVGTAVIRMEASVDELIDAAASTLKKLKADLGTEPAAFHLVHCGGRRAGIADRIGEVAEKVKKEAGNVPFIMEFTFGEYGYEDDGKNTCGGLMLSYTAFGK